MCFVCVTVEDIPVLNLVFLRYLHRKVLSPLSRTKMLFLIIIMKEINLPKYLLNENVESKN